MKTTWRLYIVAPAGQVLRSGAGLYSGDGLRPVPPYYFYNKGTPIIQVLKLPSSYPPIKWGVLLQQTNSIQEKAYKSVAKIFILKKCHTRRCKIFVAMLAQAKGFAKGCCQFSCCLIVRFTETEDNYWLAPKIIFKTFW